MPFRDHPSYFGSGVETAHEVYLLEPVEIAPPRVLKSEVPILGPFLKVLDKVSDLGTKTGEWIKAWVMDEDPPSVIVVAQEILLGVPRELNQVAADAGASVAEMIKGTGESFGAQVHPFVKALMPKTVAIYLGSQLLTVVASAVAAEMLAGMKRSIRDRVRVRM